MLPILRHQDREGAAVAQQSAVQKRFEDPTGQASESTAALRFNLAASTVRVTDLCYLERW